MLIAAETAPVISDSLLGSLIQGGSFGLLTLVVIYVGRVLIPKIFAEHQRMLDEHRAERERDNARNDAAHARRDSGFEKFATTITAQLQNMDERLGRLEDRTIEHKHV